MLENGRLVELQIDRGDNRGFVGNIYLGKVVRVLPGMQAAFVDIGLERAAFLYVGDIFPDVLALSKDPDKRPLAKDGANASPKSGQPSIQDLVKEGQRVVVQVAKDPIGTKGARVTTHIALAGRYLVHMPTVEHIGISRRIDKDKERKRLRNLVTKYRQPGTGYIVRTVCSGKSSEMLRADMNFLHQQWKQVEEGCSSRKAPALLHADLELQLRAIRDLYSEGVQRIIMDDKTVFDETQTFMKEFMPDAAPKVQLYRGKEPIFDTYGVESEIQSSLGRKVWLKSGGYLVIDQTEALMAIDINSGKYVGTSSSLEETTTNINLEAAEEIAIQLRLRNMGGIIIIDFIDMDNAKNRDRVYKAMDQALRRDRARTNILKISDLGLVQMTRKRVQEGLDRFLHTDCPTCGGTGVVRSLDTLAYELLRAVQREANKHENCKAVLVNTTPELADLMYNKFFADLTMFEERIKKPIVLRALPNYKPEQFEVYAS
jgi:ribonuclease G